MSNERNHGGERAAGAGRRPPAELGLRRAPRAGVAQLRHQGRARHRHRRRHPRRACRSRPTAIDYITSIHALPEIPYPDLVPALIELRRVLKPGGVLRLALPDLDRASTPTSARTATTSTCPTRTRRSIGAKFVTQMIWYGYSRSLFMHDFVEELLERAGFSRGRPLRVQADREPVAGHRRARQPRAREPLRGGRQIATVLFYRDFKRFTGGDLKVWDYFNHVRSSPRHTALVRFTRRVGVGRDQPLERRARARPRRGRGRRLRRALPVRHRLARR